jgi:hypothetical protein
MEQNQKKLKIERIYLNLNTQEADLSKFFKVKSKYLNTYTEKYDSYLGLEIDEKTSYILGTYHFENNNENLILVIKMKDSENNKVRKFYNLNDSESYLLANDLVDLLKKEYGFVVKSRPKTTIEMLRD